LCYFTLANDVYLYAVEQKYLQIARSTCRIMNASLMGCHLVVYYILVFERSVDVVSVRVQMQWYAISKPRSHLSKVASVLVNSPTPTPPHPLSISEYRLQTYYRQNCAMTCVCVCGGGVKYKEDHNEAFDLFCSLGLYLFVLWNASSRGSGQ